MLLFGQEGPGLSELDEGRVRRDLRDRPVRLDPLDQRRGAAAIAMHAWVRVTRTSVWPGAATVNPASAPPWPQSRDSIARSGR